MHKVIPTEYSNTWVFNFLWQATTSIVVGWFGAARAQITISGIPNRLNNCLILWRRNSQMWPRAAYYNMESRGKEIRVLIWSKVEYY